MNRKNIFTIYAKRNNASATKERNANKFLHAIVISGKEAMQAKLAELRNAGIKIEAIYNGIGKKIDF